MKDGLDAVVDLISPVLSNQGFERDANNFRRIHGGIAHVISFQRRSDRLAFAVNLGSTPLPIDPERDWSSHSEADSWFRGRLAPAGHADHWFLLESGAAQIAARVIALLETEGMAFFEPLQSLHSLAAQLSLDAIDAGRLARCFSHTTRVRLAFVAARVNLHLGKVAQARAAAEYGMANIGRAVSLKREFREILQAS